MLSCRRILSPPCEALKGEIKRGSFPLPLNEQGNEETPETLPKAGVQHLLLTERSS